MPSNARPMSAPLHRSGSVRRKNSERQDVLLTATTSQPNPLVDLLSDQNTALQDAQMSFESYKSNIPQPGKPGTATDLKHPRPPSAQRKPQAGWNNLDPIEELFSDHRTPHAPMQAFFDSLKTTLEETIQPFKDEVTTRLDGLEKGNTRILALLGDNPARQNDITATTAKDLDLVLPEDGPSLDVSGCMLSSVNEEPLQPVAPVGVCGLYGAQMHAEVINRLGSIEKSFLTFAADVMQSTQPRLRQFSQYHPHRAPMHSFNLEQQDVQISVDGMQPRPSFRTAMRRVSSLTSLDRDRSSHPSFHDIVCEILHGQGFAGGSVSTIAPKRDCPHVSFHNLSDPAGILDLLFEVTNGAESSDRLMHVLLQGLLVKTSAERVGIWLGKRLSDHKGISRAVFKEKDMPDHISYTREELLANELYVAEYDSLPGGGVPDYTTIVPVVLEQSCIGVVVMTNVVEHSIATPAVQATDIPNYFEVMMGAAITESRYEFSEVSVQLASTVLLVSAPLIKSTFVNEKTEADRSLLAEIVEIINMMGRTTEIPALVQQAIQGAKRLVDAESCHFFLTKEQETGVYLLDGVDKIRESDISPIIREVASTRETVLNPTDTNVPASYLRRIQVDKVQSIMVCPIFSEGGLYGVIEMMNSASGSFSEFDSMLIGSLGNYVGISMQHTYSTKLLDNASAKASAMIAVCRDLAAVTLDPEALQSRIMEHARSIVNADRASLFICDWQRKVLIATFGNQIVTMPIAKGIAGTVATTGEALNIIDAYSDARFNKAIDQKSGYRTQSLLAVPVKCEGQVVAVAQLINKRGSSHEPVSFDKHDESLLDTFSTFAGISLKISAQYRELCKEKQKFKTMLDAAVGVADTDIREGVDQLCKTIIHQAKQLIVADRCSLFMIDKETSQLFSCVTDQSGGEIRFGMHQGIAGQVVQLGVTLNIPDAYKDQNFNTENDRSRGYRTKTILAAPIKFEGCVIAVMQLVNKLGSERFDDEDEKTLNFFASLAGIALRNSQLFEFATKGSQELASVLYTLHSSTGGGGAHAGTLRVSELESKIFVEISNVRDSVCREELESTCTAQFNIHQYRTRDDGVAVLLILVQEMFSLRGLTDHFKINSETLTRFLVRLTVGYRKVPYHNVYHAIDVTQTLFQYLCVLPTGLFTKLEEFVLLVCGMCHDVDHMGLNNSFHYKAETPLGILSSATGGGSPLEIHHCNYSIGVLQNSIYNIFANFPDQAEEVLAYKLIVKCILGTDMALHGNIAKEMKALDASMIETSKELCLTILLKAADVSNITKPFETSRVWAYYVLDEFYMQGDQEAKRIGEISNEMFDRNNKKEVAEGQLGFMGFMKPFYAEVCRIFPEMSYLLDQLDHNAGAWRDINEQKVQPPKSVSTTAANEDTAPAEEEEEGKEGDS